MVGFDQFDQLWMGVGEQGNLRVHRIRAEPPVARSVNLPLYLRVEQRGSEYTLKYRMDSYNELVYLRARHIIPIGGYAPGMERFLTRHTWAGGGCITPNPPCRAKILERIAISDDKKNYFPGENRAIINRTPNPKEDVDG